MTDNLFWLTEAQFEGLRPLLPDNARGVPRADDRKVISGIVHVLKSGCRWADAPSEYGPRKTLYNRFVRWSEKGHWTRIFEALADEGGPPSQALIDSSAVRAHRSAAGAKGGRRNRRSGAAAADGRRKSMRSPTASAARSGSP
jgi:transposase